MRDMQRILHGELVNPSLKVTSYCAGTQKSLEPSQVLLGVSSSSEVLKLNQFPNIEALMNKLPGVSASTVKSNLKAWRHAHEASHTPTAVAPA